MPNRSENFSSKHLENVDALESAVNLQELRLFIFWMRLSGKVLAKGQTVLYPWYIIISPIWPMGRREQCSIWTTAYGMWRVMRGLHKEIEFSLMEAGHTKFSPDWHFGLWKVKWRASNAETLEEVADTVRKSSRVGYNIPQYVNNPAKPVTFYNWTEFFRTLFKPIPGLTKYHHFRITSSHPGTVFLREYADNQEVAIEITRPQRQPIPSSDMPERIDNQELDAKRSWYLFEEIAPLCNNSSACSKPTVPKPSSGVRL
ncbi:uncharacterized protein LOC128211900 isoform X2 [Mya arenaria]|uniref:uncharacterized protein LOC128211900 isoform X2 n=1 Tax=Mya arenaria TaxID=6604 RepID=UPI0022E255FE|nr:uncharacterized protein LOC128211900 isoform X2 [Mya arenaria]